MVGMHVRFEMKPGTEDRLLEWKRVEGELQRQAPGFIKRSMSRDRDQPNVFYYVSYWRTAEQMLGFLKHPEFEDVINATGVRDAVLSRTVVRTTEVFDELGEFPDKSK